jgi:hypothetical protein
MARKALVQWIERALDDMGEASTQEITTWIDERFTWGASTNQVANLCARYKQFIKVGFRNETIKNPNGPSERYRGAIWRLADGS